MAKFDPPPQTSRHLDDHQKFVATPAKFGANPSTGSFRWNGQNITKLLFIYLCPSTDFHAWCLKRRGLAQGCAFGSFVNIVPILRVKSPPSKKIPFLRVNRRFKLDEQNIYSLFYWDCGIDFNRAQQIQNCGWPPFWKLLNFHSLSVLPFDRFWWNLARWRILVLQTWRKLKF